MQCILTIMKSFKQLPADFLSAAFTLILVAGLDLWLVATSAAISDPAFIALLSLYVVFLGLLSINTTDFLTPRGNKVRITILPIQLAVICAAFYLSPNTFNAILLVIWSGQLPYLLPFRLALLSSPLWSAVPWLFHWWGWQLGKGTIITALLFFAFNIFALIMMESRKSADAAREQAEQANREIRAMQSLLQEASKKDERTRIARDIHDVVGHHLTTLSVQLQVLARKVDAPHKAEVEQSRAIARLLLADVRAAVSDMRDNEHIDLHRSLTALVENLPGIEVDLQLPESPGVEDVDQAFTILRGVQESLTNSLRHGHAKHIRIHLQHTPAEVCLTIEDDGCGATELTYGCGLKGMDERVKALGGQLQVISTASGVVTDMRLPRRQGHADG